MRTEPTAPSASGGVDLSEYIDAALAKLPDRDASALALRYLQDKPVNEVAQTLGVTPEAAGKIISRAITKLRELLTRRGVRDVGASSLSSLVVMPSASFVDTAVHTSLHPTAGSFGLEIANTTQAWMQRSVVTATTTAVAAAVILLATASGLVYAFWPGASAPLEQNVTAETNFSARPTAMPFSSPFIELVGCRIKQVLRVSAGTAASAGLKVYDNHALQIEWDPAQLPAGKSDPIEVSIRSFSDNQPPKTIWSKRVASNVHAVPYTQTNPMLPANWLPAGDYQIEMARAGQVFSTTLLKIEPTPDTVADIFDIQSDGSVRFTQVAMFISSSPTPLGSSSAYFIAEANVETLVGDDLLPLERRTDKITQPGQIRFTHNPPVQPGEAILLATSGTYPKVKTRPDGSFEMEQFIGSRTKKPAPSRRIHLIRLPVGVESVTVEGTDQYRVIDGRMQVFDDGLFAPGDFKKLNVRYRLPQSAATNEGR